MVVDPLGMNAAGAAVRLAAGAAFRAGLASLETGQTQEIGVHLGDRHGIRNRSQPNRMSPSQQTFVVPVERPNVWFVKLFLPGAEGYSSPGFSQKSLACFGNSETPQPTDTHNPRLD